MKAEYFSSDILEFLAALSKYQVDYVIVGGEAVIYYGHARLTGDIDFFYDNSEKNAQQLFNALKEFWDNSIPGIESYNELTEKGVIVQFGKAPNRIDIFNQIDGVSFKQAWGNKLIETLNIAGRNCSIYFIGLNELIVNKKASNRPKDQEDLKFLI